MQNTQAVESHLHTGHVNTSESEDLHLPHHKPRDVAVLLLHTGYVNTVNQVCVIITLRHSVELYFHIGHVNTVNWMIQSASLYP